MDMIYRMRDNNCHKFVIHLLNIACLVGRKLVTTSFGFSQQTMGPKYEYNSETGEYEKVEMPPPKEPKPPKVYVSTDLFYSEDCAVMAGRTTEEAYLLSEEEKGKVLGRALEIMGGEFEGW
jgi:hypothetical protein